MTARGTVRRLVSQRENKGMVDQRYDSSHPEGFVDHRYPDHKGNLGQEAKKKKGWTGRQKDMHKEIGKQIARESNRKGSSGPIRVNSDLGHPIDLRSISSQQTFREGWNGGMSYSPPVKRIKKVMEAEAGAVEIKEF
jgi:hypothetical protein